MTELLFTTGQDGTGFERGKARKLPTLNPPKHGNYKALVKGYCGKGEPIYFIEVYTSGKLIYTHEFKHNLKEAKNWGMWG